jgi:phosphatidylglycerophosphate synthase
VGAILLHVRRQQVQAARFLGKAASLLSFLALFFLLVRWPGGLELFYAAIAATYAAGVDYYIAARSLEKSTP